MKLTEALRLFRSALYGEVAPTTLDWYIIEKDNRFRGMLASLLDVLGDIPVCELAPAKLYEWREKTYGDHPNPRTRHGYFRAMKRFVRWLYYEGLIPKDIVGRMKPPPLPTAEPRAISPEDIEALLAAAAAYSQHPERDQAIILLLIETGCRVGGLCGLKMDDIDIQSRKAWVREKGRGGSGKARWVFFTSDRTYEALCKYLEIRPCSTVEHLFISYDGRNLTGTGIRQMIERLAEYANLPKVPTPHQFRHAAVRRWLRNGNLNIASKLAGHSSVTVTSDIYGVWAYDELKKWHKELNDYT